jgi:hypothetical protein
VDFPSDIINPPKVDRERRLRLKRLTTDPRMKFVWRRLEPELRKVAEAEVHPVHPQHAVEAWLRGYLYAAINADSDAGYWRSALSAQEQRDMMRRIGRLARELVDLLGDPLGDLYVSPKGYLYASPKFTLWDTLARAVCSASRAPASVQELLGKLAETTYGRHWSQGKSKRLKLSSRRLAKNMSFPLFPFFPYFPLDSRALLGDLPSQLRGLAKLAELSLADDARAQSKPPNKTKRLDRTVYVRNLVRYAHDAGLKVRPSAHREAGFHLYKILAITANVALDLSGRDQVTSDMVRKMSDMLGKNSEPALFAALTEAPDGMTVTSPLKSLPAFPDIPFR